MSKANKKPTIAAASLSAAAGLDGKFNVVTPRTKLAARMFWQYVAANNLLGRLSEGIAWGQVEAEDYIKATQALTAAVQGVEDALKSVRPLLQRQDSERSKKKDRLAKTVSKVEAAKEIKKTATVEVV